MRSGTAALDLLAGTCGFRVPLYGSLPSRLAEGYTTRSLSPVASTGGVPRRPPTEFRREATAAAAFSGTNLRASLVMQPVAVARGGRGSVGDGGRGVETRGLLRLQHREQHHARPRLRVHPGPVARDQEQRGERQDEHYLCLPPRWWFPRTHHACHFAAKGEMLHPSKGAVFRLESAACKERNGGYSAAYSPAARRTWGRTSGP